jgi:hypothetical protein
MMMVEEEPAVQTLFADCVLNLIYFHDGSILREELVT